MLGPEEFHHVFLYEHFSVSSVQCATCPIRFGCGWGARVTAARFHPSSCKGLRDRIPESISSGLYFTKFSLFHRHQLTNMHERLHIKLFNFFDRKCLRVLKGCSCALIKSCLLCEYGCENTWNACPFRAVLKGLFSEEVKLNYIILERVNA